MEGDIGVGVEVVGYFEDRKMLSVLTIDIKQGKGYII